MNHHENQQRKYYGPPRLERVSDETELNDARGMPGGRSPRERYDTIYGRGNWEASQTRHEQSNDKNLTEDRQALRVVAEGVKAGRRGEGRTPRPNVVDVLVYPDGDAHKAEQEPKSSTQ